MKNLVNLKNEIEWIKYYIFSDKLNKPYPIAALNIRKIKKREGITSLLFFLTCGIILVDIKHPASRFFYISEILVCSWY